MAPELRTESATAKSDQYAFFVSLYDAVGTRRDLSAPRIDLTSVPRRLRPVLRRGLSREPSARWPTMDAAVAALERAAAPSRRGVAVVAGAALALVATVAFAARREGTNFCAGLEQRIEATWGTERSARLDDAMADTAGYVREAWQHTKPQLDAAVDALSDTATTTCTAAWDGENLRSGEDAQRLVCLETQLLELNALLRQVEDDPAAVGPSLPKAVAEFAPLAVCAGSDPTPLPPESQRVAEAMATVRGQLHAGRFQAASESMESVLRRAHVQPDSRIRAEALFLGAQVARSSGALEQTEQRLQGALQEAAAGGHDELAASIWILSIEVALQEFGRIDEARRMLSPARAALARAGSGALLSADLTAAEALVAERSAEPERAVSLYREALKVYEAEVAPTHPRISELLHRLARALRGAGVPEQSVPYIERALKLSRERLGPGHPDVALHLIGLGSAANFSGDHEAALAAFDEAVEILTTALGPEHPRVAIALHDRGNALAALRRFDEAYEDLRRAADLDRVTLGHDNPGRTQSLYGLAMVQRFRGELADAQRLMDEALSVQERAWGTEHPDLAYVVGGLADLAAAREDYDTAIMHFGRARTLLEPALGPSHPRLVYPLLGEGRAELAREAPSAAVPLLENAHRILQSGPHDPMLGAEVALVLAQSLHAAQRDAPRVELLLGQARQACAGERAEATLCAEVSDWPPG
jgi:eukaryotic-like serine/threonine-protein kinase